MYVSTLLILALLLVTTQPYFTFSTPTFHVAITGDDSGSGSESSPWRTIGRGVLNLKPGDTLIVHEGEYNEAVDIGASGAEQAYIRIVGQGRVVLTGDGIDREGVVLRSGVSFLELEGIRITGFTGRWGLALYGDNEHITMRDVEVDHCETGMRVTVGYSGERPEFGKAEYIALESVYLHHNTIGGFDCTPGPCHHLTVRSSEFAYNGVEAGFGADGLAVEIGEHILVEKVRSHHNKGDGIDIGSRNPLTGNKGEDIVVRESEVYANELNGLKLWTGGAVVNCIIHSNGVCPVVIIYDGRYAIVNTLVAKNARENRDYAMTAGYPLEGGLAGNSKIMLTVFNSIFAFNGPSPEPTGVYIGRGVTLLSDYNIWYSRPDEEIYFDAKEKFYSQDDINTKVLFAQTGNDEHSTAADPMFVDIKEDNFNLLSGSPAIDAGTPALGSISAPGVDILGHRRPLGKYDIGPVEYGSSSVETTRTSSTTLTSSQGVRLTTATTQTTVQETVEPKSPTALGPENLGLITVALVLVAAATCTLAVVRLRSQRRRPTTV